MIPEIRLLNADGGDPLFTGVHTLLQQLAAEGDPELDPEPEEVTRSRLRGNDVFQKHTLVATASGAVVGVARMRFHHIEGNADLGEVRIEVAAQRRRRGVGRRLLDAVVAHFDTLGRTKVIGEGLHGPPTHGFWSAAGAELALVERMSRVWVDRIDPALMQRWIDGRRERAAGYRLEFWRGRTPERFLEPLALLTTAMNDAPTEDLDIGDDVWTAGDVASVDDYLIGADMERWTTIAFAPDGAPAGLTVLQKPNASPRFTHQGDTVVLAEHRNRGLGRWLKADMVARVRAQAPEIEALDTTNAGTNAAMLGINEAMGFRPVHDLGYWQADTDTLRAGKPGA